MAKQESSQHRLARVRPPRVQITYDVELAGAIEKKELPFVMGVLADLSGQPAAPLPRLKERAFVAIDRDNFDEVLRGAKPRLAYRVPNALAADDTQLAVELEFRSLEDFAPERVARQVEPLAKLLEIRERLSDLRNKMAGNEKFEDLLAEVLASTDKLQAIAREAAAEGSR
jgi:type VI secretion system protein ImpB